MYERLPDARGDPVEITIDGRPFVARAGDSVAAALIAAGRIAVRTRGSGSPRGPYCLAGACFDCLVTIDERPGRQACLTTVSPGMRVETSLPPSS